MNHRLFISGALIGLVYLTWPGPVCGQPTATPAPRPADSALQRLVDQALHATLAQFAPQKLQSNQLAVTVVDLSQGEPHRWASFRGQEPIYPASVVKLFYLVAAHQWLEDGRLADTAELRRALRDMIVDSSNDATHYVVDLLTDTTSGPELPEAELDRWFEKRNGVNRYFAALGYTNINVNRKPWCEGPYGREAQSVRRHQPSRNLLSTDATARLLVDTVLGRAVTPVRSAQMLELMQRDPFKPSPAGCEPHQATDFIGQAVPAGGRLWSKAGWTSQVRHDAAYVELPGGGRVVLVIFTVGHSYERGVIGALARPLLDALNTPTGPAR